MYVCTSETLAWNAKIRWTGVKLYSVQFEYDSASHSEASGWESVQSLIKPSISPCIYSCNSPCTFVYVVISFVLEFDHCGRAGRVCMAPTLRQSVRWMDKTAAQFSQTEAPRVAFTANRKILFSFIGCNVQIKLVEWIWGNTSLQLLILRVVKSMPP